MYYKSDIFNFPPVKKAKILERQGYPFDQIIDETIACLEIKTWVYLPEETNSFYLKLKENWYGISQIIEDILKTVNWYDWIEIN